MINRNVHIVIDLHGTKDLLYFKNPIEKEVLKNLVVEFKEKTKDKKGELYLSTSFLDFLHEKGYKDADIVKFGATIDLHDYLKDNKDNIINNNIIKVNKINS